jgi:hypothetical protein
MKCVKRPTCYYRKPPGVTTIVAITALHNVSTVNHETTNANRTAGNFLRPSEDQIAIIRQAYTG